MEEKTHLSGINLFPRVNDRIAAVGFTVIGTAIALIFPIERYTDFLYGRRFERAKRCGR
ncbi:MAG: hypothetical protein AABZ40_07670 [Thermodesulfobacteriota bacterium]